MMHRSVRVALIGLDGFAAVSALAGMVACLGGALPLRLLAGGPFADYTVPGLILGIGVGGSSLLAGLATARDPGLGAALSLPAGLIMMGWIVGEYLLLPDIRFGLATFDTWMQPLYFLVGLAVTMLAWSGLPSPRHAQLS